MCFAKGQQHLYERRDHQPPITARKSLHSWDVTTQQHLTQVDEFMESYDLCCGPLLMDEADGNELLCGACHNSTSFSNMCMLRRAL